MLAKGLPADFYSRGRARAGFCTTFHLAFSLSRRRRTPTNSLIRKAQ